MITDQETSIFQEYLDRGGFAIFDDFDGPYDWANFQRCIRQVLPERNLERLTVPIPFFSIFTRSKRWMCFRPPIFVTESQSFWASQMKRDGCRPSSISTTTSAITGNGRPRASTLIRLSSKAFKFGINYVIDALSH
jgi:hypothetical protein